MANNRFQLYCKKCHELVCVAKFYPTIWYCSSPINNAVDDFLNIHSISCWQDDESADHGGGTGMFAFRTELDDDGWISDYHERPYKVVKETPHTTNGA